VEQLRAEILAMISLGTWRRNSMRRGSRGQVTGLGSKTSNRVGLLRKVLTLLEAPFSQASAGPKNGEQGHLIVCKPDVLAALDDRERRSQPQPFGV
jgi:hypothetical protein